MTREPYPSHITHPLDNYGQSLTIVAHSSQQEDHFWDKVTVLADVVRLHQSSVHGRNVRSEAGTPVLSHRNYCLVKSLSGEVWHIPHIAGPACHRIPR